jgi:hypothetical protein
MRLLISQAAACLKIFEKDFGKIDFNQATAIYDNCPGAA